MMRRFTISASLTLAAILAVGTSASAWMHPPQGVGNAGGKFFGGTSFGNYGSFGGGSFGPTGGAGANFGGFGSSNVFSTPGSMSGGSAAGGFSSGGFTTGGFPNAGGIPSGSGGPVAGGLSNRGPGTVNQLQTMPNFLQNSVIKPHMGRSYPRRTARR